MSAREAAEDMREAAAKLTETAYGDLIVADAIRALPIPQDAQPWISLSDDDRIAVMNGLPDALDGFLKTWGWLHFAKAIEAKCRALNDDALKGAPTGDES